MADVELLAKDPHRFETRYLDSLIVLTCSHGELYMHSTQADDKAKCCLGRTLSCQYGMLARVLPYDIMYYNTPLQPQPSMEGKHCFSLSTL